MMKIKLAICLFLLVCLSALLAPESKGQTIVSDPNAYYGVWANKDCELVQTDKFTMLFVRNGSKISAILRQNEREGNVVYSNFLSGYVFDNETKKYEKVCSHCEKRLPVSEYLKLENGNLTVNHSAGPLSLELVEKITICPPYEMPLANESNIGECLQSWQLGTSVESLEPDKYHVQIGTNRHSYVFMESPMVYCRTARLRHNNNGSVFAQNVRMMANSREFTTYMSSDNLAATSEEIVINDSLFNPNACVFVPDGSIYWSFISLEPDTILLNGCGEIYTFGRPPVGNGKIVEWYEYKAY